MKSEVYLYCEDNDENMTAVPRSELGTCPGCGTVDSLEVLNSTMDDPQFQIFCRSCQWLAAGETIAEATENWNRRAAPILEDANKQAAREKAIEIFRKTNPPKPYPYNQLVVSAYAQGYDAGLKAASSEWVRIETVDDLPKEDGEYLVTINTAYNDERRSIYTETQAFCDGEWESQDVVAWRPKLEPYQLSEAAKS